LVVSHNLPRQRFGVPQFVTLKKNATPPQFATTKMLITVSKTTGR
jgi:hypothetical protein